MKRCPYCGKEYPDDATHCSIDRHPLPGDTPQLSSTVEAAVENPIYLVFPDYKWSARDAWKCIGIILVFGLVLVSVSLALNAQFPAFYRSGFGRFSMATVHYGICLLVAAYFARTESLTAFWKGFGLDRKPSNYVWFGVSMALAIRFFGYFMLIHGWGKGVVNHDIIAFKHTLGPDRYFFLVPLLLLAPFFEESIYRGFLYKAFRGSYSLGISMAIIMLWTAYTHWSYYLHWVAAFDLSMLAIVQCYLREKSDSLWDCILCHFVFNASLLFASGTLH
jgi:membrane protease YdiL (CAAX protease family)